MAFVLKDRVKETSATPGTGALTLGGTSTGYQAFSVIGNGNSTYYTIYDSTTGQWEVGIGTYTTATNTLSRDTVLASTNTGNLVDFAANTKDVFVAYPAEKAVTTDTAQTLSNKTLSNANLGTPNAGVLTNVTGLPLTTGVTGTLPIANGGTNATTAAQAIENLLPSYSGHFLQFLRINAAGTGLEWATEAGLGTVTSVDVSGGTTGLTTSGGPITSSGVITLAGVLNILNGGTGATTASGARTNLGAAASGANSDITSLSGITGGISTPDYITFDTAAGATGAVGRIYWDANHGGLSYGMVGGNVTDDIGQQLYQRCYNDTGATIAKGSVVYVTGSSGTRITIAKALATSDGTSSTIIGVTAEAISNNSEGFVITEGELSNVSTSGIGDGEVLWLSPTTAGAYTDVKPTAPNHLVMVGYCTKGGSVGGGIIYVKMQNGYELDELHNVKITDPVANGSLLQYDTAGPYWKNVTASSVTVGNVSGTVAVANGGTGLTTTPTNGQIDIGNGTGFTRTTLTAGSGVSITNGSGSITISASGTGDVAGPSSATNNAIALFDGTTGKLIKQQADITSDTFTSGVGATSGRLNIGGSTTYGKVNIYGVLPTSTVGGLSAAIANVAQLDPPGPGYGVTEGYGVYNELNIATNRTAATYSHFQAKENITGTNAGVQYQAAFWADSSIGSGSVGNYGFYSGLTSGSTKWNIYAYGTAQNHIRGNVGIGAGMTSPSVALDVKGTFRLNGSTSGYVGFAPAAAAGSTTYTLPTADGTSGQVLSTDGSGTLSWATSGGGGSAASAQAYAWFIS